ncbi:ABC transporter permease [Defluviimonas sp. D31]|uniref:ABC transporter permease n=2 Tax=Albidovulum TaxID=205889 RepID=A0ABT3J3V2_9RHOB|nr:MULTISPECIES: ABC transporter permease [Defluviimonas]MCU9847927.1 ABC transporter permease [Defluviimonas sp. WL0024]MCW3782359.1 ABC transporter permease [Defluviimonas salinarum]MDW4550154.1 ABC transporter permease [Defluviimonas sp. D31]
MKHLPAYFTFWHILGHYSLKWTAYLVLAFLMLPIVIIVPLSFNAEPYFTFTDGMLALDPAAYSTRWYQAIFSDANWLLSIKNSFLIGALAATLSTVLGTIAAVGLSSPVMPFKRLITALLLSPMIVPLIIIAAGMFFFYTRFNLVGSYAGLVIAHAALGVPFVIITVTATLSGFDRSLYNAGISMGASPVKVFWDVVIPLIRPGVISGGLFAFVTSFDEVVLVLFLAGPEQRTIPRQMFSGLREQINPTILAVATLLILISIALLVTLEILRRRSERMRGTEF